jgi:uncharacterized protein YbjT (DUF2867 family)
MGILITGANGLTGHAVLRQLRGKATVIRCLTSNQKSADVLLHLGATEVVVGDLADKESIYHAAKGMTRVLHIPPRMKPDETQYGQNVIYAAKRADVECIYLHSVINSQVNAIQFHVHKRLVEEAAMTSGIPWVIFQPTNFMQNVSWNWTKLMTDGEFLFPYSATQKISWLDLDDYAQAVAKCLTESGWEYGVYECVSTKAPLTRVELAQIWSKVLQRGIKANTMPLDDYMRLPHWQGRDPREMAILRTMFEEFDKHGAPGGNCRVLSMILGRDTTSYEQFAEKFVSQTST